MAYLTDRDSEVNVFTVGDVSIDLDETFNDGAQLLPGVTIEKKPSVTNTGKNDAWVWTTVSVPGKLADVIEFGNKGTGWDWDAVAKQENVKIGDKFYTQYTILHTAALAPEEVTANLFESVTLDRTVDIDPNGDWYTVSGGDAKPLDWNNSNGNPVIYVSAYAMQTEGFNNAEEAYKAYQTQWGDNGAEYEALPVEVSNNEELDAAIKNGATNIMLKDGTYIIPDSAQGKTLKLIGSGETIIATQDDGSYEGCDYSLDGATVTFANVIINTDSSTYTGYARCKATYNNCTINGTYTLYGKSEFNNCTFNVSGDVYNIWTWGGENVTFNNCTFNSDGKAILLYNQTCNLTLNNCTFNDKGGLPDKKAAIETGVDGVGPKYNVVVNNTVVNGYEVNDKGIDTGTTLWGNKNSMGTDKLNVVVDGVDVY